MVLYDIGASQLDGVVHALETAPGVARIDTAPLVLGRIRAVNGQVLQRSSEGRRRREARNEHKLTYRANNIDNVTLDRGTWWTVEDAHLERDLQIELPRPTTNIRTDNEDSFQGPVADLP